MTIYRVTLEAQAYMFVEAENDLQAERIATRFSYEATENLEPYFEPATIELADDTYDPCDTLFTDKGETEYVSPSGMVVSLSNSYNFGASAASPSNF